MTDAQYAFFVQANDYEPPRHWKKGQFPSHKQDHPVVYVSWHDAVAYCIWLSEVTGRNYRLPTEAEWEKAARGTDGRIFPWGDEWDERLCNTKEGGAGDTTSVGTYPDGVSPHNLLDMAGNVWEWCATKKGKPYPYDMEEDEWTEENLQGGDNHSRAVGEARLVKQVYPLCAPRAVRSCLLLWNKT